MTPTIFFLLGYVSALGFAFLMTAFIKDDVEVEDRVKVGLGALVLFTVPLVIFLLNI